MIKLSGILIIIAFFFSTGLITPSEDTNAKIKAVYLYNFTKYVEWPSNYSEGNFIIDVYGNNTALLTELGKMATSKTMGKQKIEIKPITSLDKLDKCHMLFIPSENSVTFSEILSKLKGKSTLIITEKPGLAKQGAAINFVVQDNKQKFEFNKANAEKYSLKVSSNLAALAIIVE